jgi:hypothetical protein
MVYPLGFVVAAAFVHVATAAAAALHDHCYIMPFRGVHSII